MIAPAPMPLIPQFAVCDCDTSRLTSDADWQRVEAGLAESWARYEDHGDPARYRAECVAAVERHS